MKQVDIDETIEINGIIYKAELYEEPSQCKSCDLTPNTEGCNYVECLSHWGIQLVFKKL